MEITIWYEDNTEKSAKWMAIECDELFALPGFLKIRKSEGTEIEATYKQMRRVYVNSYAKHPMAIAINDKILEARNEVE